MIKLVSENVMYGEIAAQIANWISLLVVVGDKREDAVATMKIIRNFLAGANIAGIGMSSSEKLSITSDGRFSRRSVFLPWTFEPTDVVGNLFDRIILVDPEYGLSVIGSSLDFSKRISELCNCLLKDGMVIEYKTTERNIERARMSILGYNGGISGWFIDVNDREDRE